MPGCGGSRAAAPRVLRTGQEQSQGGRRVAPVAATNVCDSLDTLPSRPDYTAIVDEIQESGVDLPRVPDTRWNYMLRRGRAALEHTATLQKRHIVERVLAELEQFQHALDAVQADSASMWSTLLAMQTLLNNATGSAEHIRRRLPELYTDPYLCIAFCHPSVNRFGGTTGEDGEFSPLPGAVQVETAVANALARYDVSAEEVEAFMITPASPQLGPITYASYKRYLNSNLRARFPGIAQAVSMLLDAVPSEASVERVFSHMKWVVGDLRSRLKPENVQATLRICSFWEHLEREAAAIRAREDPSPSPRRPPQPGLSQPPAAPAVEEGRESESDSDVREMSPASVHEEHQADAPATPATPTAPRVASTPATPAAPEVPILAAAMLQNVYDVRRAAFANTDAPALEQAPEVQRITTRNAHEVCPGKPDKPCSKLIKNHAKKAFTVCERVGCIQRMALSCLGHETLPPRVVAQGLVEMKEVKCYWVCPRHAAQ